MSSKVEWRRVAQSVSKVGSKSVAALIEAPLADAELILAEELEQALIKSGVRKWTRNAAVCTEMYKALLTGIYHTEDERNELKEWLIENYPANGGSIPHALRRKWNKNCRRYHALRGYLTGLYQVRSALRRVLSASR